MTSADSRRIQNAFSVGRHDLTYHAAEELAEDDSDIQDVESAIRTGRVTRIEHDDRRGTRYTVVGMAERDGRRIGIVGRFTPTGRFLVITVFAITSPEI
jgi:hypothetical protein